MRVLHEDLVDRIRTIGQGQYDGVMAAITDMRRMLTDHMAVSNAADRRFAGQLGDHERRISTLEQRPG